ncbi:MAG: aminotransferase class IV [Deltaproteobacteria bacterium]|nr:aminotransferase class IV [Deltaproteobacteria bacterium]MBZ0220549.1 aminotransferase class IV [Deltaproteobacteria bacterium]
MRLWVYIDGKVLPEEKAAVSVFDRGLSYGDGLYETLKAKDGRPLFLREHMMRLRAGARFLGLPSSGLKAFEKVIMDGAIEALLKKNGLVKGESYVKLMLTRGPDRASHLPSRGLKPTRIIIVKPLDSIWVERVAKRGVSAIFVEDIAPPLPGVKSLNYLPSVLARMRAEKEGAFEAIFVKDGLLTEGSSSNVFLVKNGRLITSPLSAKPSTGVLAGVTRENVIRLARRHSIPVREAPIKAGDISSFDEAFITNSIIDAIPLIKASGSMIGDGRPGPIAKRIRALLKGLAQPPFRP